MQKLQDKNAGEWEKMTVDDVKSLVDSSRITTMTLKMDIEKGEFLQKDSDFRSYEWTQGRRMPVRCIVQDKNGDNQLPLENKSI